MHCELCNFLSCKRDLKELYHVTKTNDRHQISSNFRITSCRILNADANYDYTLKETELLTTDWSKALEDKFDESSTAGITTQLANWNIWTVGAFNNELQYYHAPNLKIEKWKSRYYCKKGKDNRCNLPGGPNSKNFDFTSDGIESELLFSANTATPKVQMVTRIKLPRSYGMACLLSYGDPWPTHGEIDILEAHGQEPPTSNKLFVWNIT